VDLSSVKNCIDNAISSLKRAREDSRVTSASELEVNLMKAEAWMQNARSFLKESLKEPSHESFVH